MTLHSSTHGPLLRQAPVAEMRSLRREHTGMAARSISNAPIVLVTGAAASACEVVVDIDPGSASESGLWLHTEAGKTVVGYAAATGELFIDRPGEERLAMPLSWHAARLALHVFIDRSVVEVFAGEGQATLSALLEPDAVCQGVDVFAQSGLARLAHADVWALAPVWE